VLAWHDYPGSRFTATSLVNDLHLSVSDANGQFMIGNAAMREDSSEWDTVNNVERVCGSGAEWWCGVLLCCVIQFFCRLPLLSVQQLHFV